MVQVVTLLLCVMLVQRCGVCREMGHTARSCPSRPARAAADPPRTPAKSTHKAVRQTPLSAHVSSPVGFIPLPASAQIVRAPRPSTLLPVAEVSFDLLLAYDVETTGLSVSRDKIIQLSAVLFEAESKTEVASLNLYVNPEGVPIHPRAAAAHGMDLETLRGFQPVSQQQAAHAFVDFVASNTKDADNQSRRCILVGHNQIRFDLPFVMALLARCNLSLPTNCVGAVDSLQLARHLVKSKIRSADLPQLPNYRLSTLVELETGQPLVGAHNALHDVRGMLRMLCVTHYWSNITTLCHDIQQLISKLRFSSPPSDAAIPSQVASVAPPVPQPPLPPGPTSGTTVPQLEDEWFASLANDDAAIDPDTEHSQEEMLHLRSTAAEACLDALDRSIQRLAQVEEGAVAASSVPTNPGPEPDGSSCPSDSVGTQGDSAHSESKQLASDAPPASPWAEIPPGTLKRDHPAAWRAKHGSRPKARSCRHTDGSAFGPLEIFNSLFADAAFLIVEQTNKFARLKRAARTLIHFLKYVAWTSAHNLSASKYQVRSRERAWVDLTIEEFHVFLAILVQTGIDEPVSTRFSVKPQMERRAFTGRMSLTRCVSNIRVARCVSLMASDGLHASQVSTNPAVPSLRRYPPVSDR